ncbi:MAG: DNA adenine methylase [Candidatus Eisenbacteria bacterium]|nr:DNA adenine methylase [Candidatus Eisenbacteria bacterium]
MPVMTRQPRSRKLSFWSSLPPFLGGKRKLAPLIFREIDRLIPRRHWNGLTFYDAFLGGGSASLFAKMQSFNVICTDIAERSIIVGKALIENSRVRLRWEDIVRLAADDNASPGLIESEMTPNIFTRSQGRFLDRAFRIAGETADESKAALIKLLAIRTALLCHPMSQVRSGTMHRVSTGEFESITESCVGHFVSGMRLTRPERLWALAQAINGGVCEGRGRVIKQSTFEALPEIDAAVMYADPPYEQSMAYEREYKVIDKMVEGLTRSPSPFSLKGGAAHIDTLLEAASHVPVVIVSFGNVATTAGDLEAKMLRLGRKARTLEIQYQHMPAVATAEKKEKNRELLVIGWDEAAVAGLVDGRKHVERQVH